MSDVVKIRLAEKIQLDQVRLDELYSQLGAAGAETVVCRAMEELAVRLSECSTLWRESSLIRLRKQFLSYAFESIQFTMTNTQG